MNKEVQEKSLQAIFAWIGGKSKLREKISAFFPEQNVSIKERQIQNYVEVFGGVAWMLLFKQRWATNEVYNDLNDELTNLFNIVRHHPNEFLKHFAFLPKSEKMFSYFLENEQITDIQKAVKTYCKYRWSFSANGQNFSPKPQNKMSMYRKILSLSKRFETVSIMNRSFENIIERYNKENSFLYLDPPYYDCEYLYEVKFSKESHSLLQKLLQNFKGKFCLSYNDVPEIRELYKNFKIVELETIYTCFSEVQKKQTELLIMNY